MMKYLHILLKLFSEEILHHPVEEAVAEVHHRVVEVEEARLLDADHQDVDPHHQEGK